MGNPPLDEAAGSDTAVACVLMTLQTPFAREGRASVGDQRIVSPPIQTSTMEAFEETGAVTTPVRSQTGAFVR